MGPFAPEQRSLILMEETTKHGLSLSAWDTSHHDGSDQKEQAEEQGDGGALKAFKSQKCGSDTRRINTMTDERRKVSREVRRR